MLGIPYHIQDIAQASFAKDLFQGRREQQRLTHVAYDSRLISHGKETLFVALKTGNRDGHAFIEDAYNKGVRNFLVEQEPSFSDINFALVENTLEALQSWAMFHRQRFSYPIWAITGSNGKTIVKEWLASLIEMHFQLVKSPMSYNSQLGVALSLLQLHPQADLAIIEAGISQPGEMALLEQMIRPTHGILTHMGSSHAENFTDLSHKLKEKLLLFQEVKQLIVTSFQPEILEALKGLPVKTIGMKENDLYQVSQPSSDHAQQSVTVGVPGNSRTLHIPFTGQAQLENSLLAVGAALEMGLTPADIADRLPYLYPVEMRTEIISDNPEITLINDSYNSDVDSVRNAFQQLASLDIHPHKWIIISDIPHLGDQQFDIQQQVFLDAQALVGKEHVITIGPIFQQIHPGGNYDSVESLMDHLSNYQFQDSSILLKGARSFSLEKLIPRFNHKLNATSFHIDLSALTHNYRYLKSLLPEGTKTMCMVKAASYGSGTWEIAQQLEKEGATYLAVAYASEGIELRQAGIQLPIMVINPDLSSVEALLQFDIEPEISHFPLLIAYLKGARLSDRKEYRIHLKLDTGMGRLGFVTEDLDRLIAIISQSPDVHIISVMSHLAAADEPTEDEFTRNQILRFQEMYAYLQQHTGLQSFRHILNTAGILRFPEGIMDMVRMGVGLYGINPVPSPHDLMEIGSLISSITQIHTYPAGTSIGYGRSQYTSRESQVAIVPIGYADGIPRSVGGGKASFLVKGQLAPTIGRVCMDMLMIDVTDIPSTQAGDKVLIFGHMNNHYLSINQLASAADTIPYELLVRISPRVRRIYVSD